MTPEQRAEHCRKIAAHGGAATAAKYDSHHFRAIGKAGAAVTIERHGRAYWLGLMDRRGWRGRRVAQLGLDLIAGEVYAMPDQ